MRGVYINIFLATLNLWIGIWFVERRLSEEEINWVSLFLQGPFNFFVAGWCYLSAWHRYQAYRNRFESPAPTDLGVNWSRDGF